MLKKIAYKKFVIATISLLIISIVYFYNNDSYEYTTTLSYINEDTQPIYLLDNNKYVARYKIVKKTDNQEELIKYIINNLTINKKNSYFLPTGFNSIIPENTKLLSYSIEDGLLKLNFSKEFLNIDSTMEEKLIESIVYSMLEIKGINKIMIFVDSVKLDKLPNSGKRLPDILDKNIGINKSFSINSIKDTNKTTVYYISKINDNYYYVPVTSIGNNEKEKVEVIIEKLKVSPSYNTNLMSFLKSNAELLNYEILENSVSLSFNNHIFSLNENKIDEEVKYSIALSIRDSYNISQTIFYVDEVLVDALNI
mgnify:FL=1